MTLRAQKPTNLPKTLKTWGDHIKKRRIELGLYQREVAQRLGVDGCTVTNWEKNRTTPRLRYLPRIISFLGYVPGLGTGGTLGERLVQYRITQGMTQKELASLLQVDPTTLGRWERNERQPQGKLKARCDKIFRELLHKSHA